MLRPLKNEHIAPRLLAFKIDTTSGTPSLTGGCIDDDASLTDNAAGDTSIVLKNPFARKPVVVASSKTAGGIGYGLYSSSAINTVRAISQTTAGASADAVVHALALGWDSAYATLENEHTVKSTNIRPRLIAIAVSSAGAVTVGGTQVTVSKDSGTHTITFKNPFNMAPVVIAGVLGSTAGCANIDSTSVSGCVIKTTDAAGSAATGMGFHAIIVGWDSSSVRGTNQSVVRASQRLSRIVAASSTGAATPVVNIGSTDLASITNAGNGVYTVTFKRPGKRAPIVVASGDISGNGAIVNTDSTTASTAIIRTFNNAGSGTNATEFDFIAIHFGDAAEY